MYFEQFRYILSTVVISTVMCDCACAADLGWHKYLVTTPMSYYDAAVPNVLKCEKLCERQGKCAAVTFDTRKRRCYMHDTTIKTPLRPNDDDANGHYLFKNFVGKTQNQDSTHECDKETDIRIPTAQNNEESCLSVIGQETTTQPTTTQPTTTTTTTTSTTTTTVPTTTTTPTTTTPPSTQRKVCPLDKGYRLWTYPDMNLCLRYNFTEISSQHDACNECNKSGGHLLLIENDKMRQRLFNISQEMNATGGTYVDGLYKNKTDVFINWKGEDMTWFMWAKDEPSKSKKQTCMKVNRKRFLMKTANCFKSRGYSLCQIDM